MARKQFRVGYEMEVRGTKTVWAEDADEAEEKVTQDMSFDELCDTADKLSVEALDVQELKAAVSGK